MYESLRSHPEYRVALDITGPFPQNLRHNGLTTPQGFDPLLPMQYKTLVDRIGHFRTNREFELNPENEKDLQLLGVRYFVSARNGPYLGLRLLEPASTYFKVFEYVDPRPAYGWEEQDVEHAVEMKIWQPEKRAFAVRSTRGGHFRLTEQFYPGWTATVDNVETKIERCQEAFQCVAVTPGEHRIEFRYHSRWLMLGAGISFCSMLAVVVFVFI